MVHYPSEGSPTLAFPRHAHDYIVINPRRTTIFTGEQYHAFLQLVERKESGVVRIPGA